MIARHPRAFVAAMVALAAVFWTSLGATVVFAHRVLDGVPDRAALGRVTDMARASVLYDRKGVPAFVISREERFEVPLERISPHLKQAILAIEDQRFYDHHGIDVIRIGGAALANLREGRAAQGASTITQQLARMSFLTLEKTFTRKLQEIVLALLLEAEYSKDQILELYLNKAYFGSGLYGAEAASMGYFGKPAADLTVSEAALLAGLVKAPTSYAPTTNLERALARRDVVLAAMRDMGAIDEATYEASRAEQVELADALGREEPFGQYFKEHVRRELVARFGEDRVYEGGLRVFTTIDVDMQRAADAEVRRVLDELEKRRAGRGAVQGDRLQAALVALDPATGEVRAMVGGRDFAASSYNRAVQARRQPGSAFKPFVYAAALESGYTPASLITDLNAPISTPEGAWIPEDQHFADDAITMRAALRMSSNRAAVRMIEDVGIRKAVAYAKSMGVGEVPAVPSAALGSGEVTLEALTAAYAVFANGGERRTPIYITRVEDAEGEVLFRAQPESERVISPQVAFLMNDMLADVIDHGTAWRVRQLGFRLPAAGKTGTTNDYKDAWFVGYTPRLVTGVWIGFDQPRTILVNGYASDVAVPLWAGFMRKATAGHKPEPFSRPGGLETAQVCRLSGKRATAGCESVLVSTGDGSYVLSSTAYTEYFVRGTAPDEYCDLHTVSVDGRRAAWGSAIVPVAPTSPATFGRAPDQPVDAEAAGDRAASEGEPRETEAPPRKKRGFWARLFGIGDDDEKKKAPEETERPRRPRDRERERDH